MGLLVVQGGNLQLKEVQCLQKVQGLQVWEVLLGDNPHPLGLLEEEVEMMMVMMMIMVMKVMMKMKTQKRFQIVVKMKKGLHPQMMVQVEEEGHHHPHHLVEEQLKVNQEDQEVIEVKEVTEVGQDLREKEV